MIESSASLTGGVDVDALGSHLASIPEISPMLPITEIERIGGGQSNLTFRVHLAHGSVILRRPPLGPLPPRAHDVLREHRVMQALANGPVPVPRMFHACEDQTIIGAPFFLMEDVHGDAIRFQLPPDYIATPGSQQVIAEAMIDALAALHSVDPASVGLESLSRLTPAGRRPDGYLARQIVRWKGQLEYARVRPAPDLDWTGEWLERNVPEDIPHPRIVHGDYKLDNALFSTDTPPRLLAIVDWEMAALGDPLADLGWLLAFWCENGTPPPKLTILPRLTEAPEFPRRRELADRYARQTGRELPDLRFYLVLALWKMAVLLEGHWARHVRGTAGSFDYGYLEMSGPAFAEYVRSVADTPSVIP